MDVRIEKLVYGGDGLAHHEGQAVFVPFVLPGEEVSVEPIQRKKKFVRGRVERLLSSSPERSIPFALLPNYTAMDACAVFGLAGHMCRPAHWDIAWMAFPHRYWVVWEIAACRRCRPGNSARSR